MTIVPLGGMLHGITDRIASFLSVGDLVCYLASAPQFDGAPASECGNRRKRKHKPPERAGEEDDDDEDSGGLLLSFLNASRTQVTPEHDATYECEEGLLPQHHGRQQQRCHHHHGAGHIIGSIVWISFKPSCMAFDAIKGTIMALLDKLPLLTLLQWGCVHMSAGWHLAEHLARLPLTLGHHIMSAIIGSVETLMLVAAEVWCELRRLGVKELFCVVACLLRREPAAAAAAAAGAGSAPDHRGSATTATTAGSHASALLSTRSHHPFSLDPFGYGMGGGGSCMSGDDSGGLGYGFGVGEMDRVDPLVLQRQAELRHRLDRLNRTAKLVAYQEKSARGCGGNGGAGAGSLSRSRAERLRRMMHYDVPLHPFQATVAVDPHSISPLTGHGVDELGALSTGGMALYMCTPQSFPPTPVSRACVMSRSTQFSDDVLFLARDHLRLDEQCRSRHSDETSRLTAEFLRSQARLAVLNGHAAADGISLTCGHHCAAKTGTAQLYSSVRAMVPVLRNRYVFCQFSVAAQEAIVPSLSIGLSTPEMPLNTLVGTWSHSIGLSSSGQILLSSRWYSCVPGRGTFGVGSTIGVLVFLDGSKVIPSWDGEMVTAYITYSVDGQPVRTTQRPQALLASLDAAATAEAGAVAAAAAAAGGGGHGSAAQAAASAAAAAEPYAMALPLPRDRDLFPTLTLHSPLTQVFCRFCAADMVHATRAQIGAPPGVVVYALDGSVVLDRDQA